MTLADVRSALAHIAYSSMERASGLGKTMSCFGAAISCVCWRFLRPQFGWLAR